MIALFIKTYFWALQIEKLEDERIELKKKIRKLAQQTGQRYIDIQN